LARQKIRPQILTAAIALFGSCGCDRIRTKDLAREAGVLEAAIRRYFGSKERLYLVALTSVVDGSINDLAQFALRSLQEDSCMKKSFESLVKTAVRRWYLSLSKPGARLLQQAIMTDTNLKALAHAPLEQITGILTRAMQDFGKTTVCDGKTIATTLILALFQLKVSHSDSISDELHQADRFLQEWIAGLPP
jgi:AcrR family transcriptional regulator